MQLLVHFSHHFHQHDIHQKADDGHTVLMLQLRKKLCVKEPCCHVFCEVPQTYQAGRVN